MKRSIWFVIPSGIGLIILLSIGLLFAFEKDNFASAEDKNECNYFSKKLKIAAGKKGGGSYKFATTLKEIVEKYSQGNICIIPEETDGTTENLEKLDKNEVQLATAQRDILIMEDLPELQSTSLVIPKNDSPSKTQVLSLLYLDAYQLVVKDNLKIESVSDLEGKRIAMPPKKGGQIRSLAFLMQHYRLLTEGIGEPTQKVNLVNVEDADDAFCDGKVDAVFHVRATGNKEIGRLLKECNGRLVSIDQVRALNMKNPYLESYEIPEGAYQGGKNPIPNYGDNQQKITTVSTPRLLLVNQNAEKEIIRKITKILYEHQQELVREIPLLANMVPPNNLKGVGLPIHPGARAYYDREKPSWLEENSGILEVLVGILGIGVPGFLWLNQRLEQTRKNKADDYIREVSALMDAEDCIKTIIEYLDPNNSNDNQRKQKLKGVIVEKAAKILLETKLSEIARRKKLISFDSSNSFKNTQEIVICAIKKISREESTDILQKIAQVGRVLLDNRRKKYLKNQLLPFNSNWFNLPGLISLEKLQYSHYREIKEGLNEKVKQYLNTEIDTSNWESGSDLAPLLSSELMEISQSLNTIFKRAVNALLEERISQESFQSFRVIWQIAVGDVEDESQ